ncbi:MAG: TauD/TfdA dioxygenase family protein [Alphaproteobacteria bacterium]
MQQQTESGTTRSKAKFEVVPISSALGAEIRGVDLSRADAAAVKAIRDAWLEHVVLLFRDQDLSDDALADFSRNFGELDVAPPMETSQGATHPEILIVSNVKENGKAIGTLGDGEAIWHSDMNYMDAPPTGSLLYSLEVPPAGGDTGFCNMYKALDTLPPDIRRRIDGLSIKHDSSTNSGGYLRQGSKPVDDVRTCPGAVHPMVCTHPETGRKSLFIGRRRHAYIMGLPLAESEKLLDAIWAHATRKDLTWHHRWRVGDVLMWDNRCAMHRRDSFDPATRRLMHRTQIKGSKPS